MFIVFSAAVLKDAVSISESLVEPAKLIGILIGFSSDISGASSPSTVFVDNDIFEPSPTKIFFISCPSPIETLVSSNLTSTASGFIIGSVSTTSAVLTVAPIFPCM